MKKYLFSFVMSVCIIAPLLAQQDNQQLYERKIHNFTNLSTAGWTMAGFGAGLVITGTVLLASLPSGYWDYDIYDDYEYDPADDVKAVGGIIGVALGIGLIAGGVTMGSIATHKIKQYQGKLNNLSVGMICTPDRQGISLIYRF